MTRKQKVKSPPPTIQPEKAVAPVPLDEVVRAYLTSSLSAMKDQLVSLEAEKREAEVGMIAQLNRAIGQYDGKIASLRDRILGIEKELAPVVNPSDDESNADQPDEPEGVIA